MERKWTDDMGEIFGFREEVCRIMFFAGLEWLEKHSEEFNEEEQNQKAEAMIKFMSEAVDTKQVDRNMLYHTVRHVVDAHRVGWDAYCAERRKAL